MPDLRPILTCFVHPTLLFTVCKRSWQLSLIRTNSNQPRASQMCCEIGWGRRSFLYRSKQQGLCTIWNSCTKSQAKAYKGDKSSYLPSVCHPTWGTNTSDQLQTETCCLDNDPYRAWDPHSAGICYPGTGDLSIHHLRKSFLLYLRRTKRKTAALCFTPLCVTSELSLAVWGSRFPICFTTSLLGNFGQLRLPSPQLSPKNIKN